MWHGERGTRVVCRWEDVCRSYYSTGGPLCVLASPRRRAQRRVHGRDAPRRRRGHGPMRTRAQYAAPPPLPVSAASMACTAVLCLHLALVTGGPRCHLSSHRVLHAGALGTGMPSTLGVTRPQAFASACTWARSAPLFTSPSGAIHRAAHHGRRWLERSRPGPRTSTADHTAHLQRLSGG